MRLLHPLVLTAAILCAGCAQLSGVLPVGRSGSTTLADDITIMRDRYGVPHILADSDAAVAFGIGYAQAEDGFHLMEEQYLHALGRASHWHGERYLASDLVQAAFEIERLAREEYAREPAPQRAIWDAFAAGINYYVGTSGVRPRLLTQFEPWMPFALARTIAAGTIVDGLRLGVTVDSAAGLHLVGEWAAPDVHAATHGGAGALIAGGTLVAAAPERAAGGNAMLLYSESGPFDAGAPPWEVMLQSGEGWHVRGHAPLGSPVPVAGHNGSIAWAHTSAGGDAADAFRVIFDHPTDPLMYRHDDGWRSASEWQDTLLVNTPQGVQQRAFTFRRTHIGPVVAMQGDTAIAVHFALMSEGGSLQQLLAESRATTLDDFRSALDRRALVAHTLYADTTGAIYRLLGNAVPARDTTLDRTAPVDGGTSASEWTGYLPLAVLPQTLDPSRGLLHAGHAGAAADRLLEADTSWTLERWATVAFNTWLADAEERIVPLITEWEQVGGSNAARARRLDEAVELLRSWDYMADTSSVEATLFVLWQERLRTGSYTGEYALFRAMEDAVTWLEQEHGGARVQWGAVSRLQRPQSGEHGQDGSARPVGGAPAWAGSLLVVETETAAGSRFRYTSGGTRLVGAIEMAGTVRMRSVVPFGQTADPASTHWNDQMSLFAAGAMKEAWFTRAEAEAAAVETYRPGGR